MGLGLITLGPVVIEIVYESLTVEIRNNYILYDNIRYVN
jgi:hypothetical protein